MTSLSGTLLQVDRRTWLMVTADRWHAIWLRFGAPAPQMNRATGHSIPEVAQTLGYSTRWVRDTLHR
jgi:hypothetical protein